MKRVIFVGAGEYAESVYDSMAKEEYDLIGFVDEYKKGYHMGKPILAAASRRFSILETMPISFQ